MKPKQACIHHWMIDQDSNGKCLKCLSAKVFPKYYDIPTVNYRGYPEELEGLISSPSLKTTD